MAYFTSINLLPLIPTHHGDVLLLFFMLNWILQNYFTKNNKEHRLREIQKRTLLLWMMLLQPNTTNKFEPWLKASKPHTLQDHSRGGLFTSRQFKTGCICNSSSTTWCIIQPSSFNGWQITIICGMFNVYMHRYGCSYRHENCNNNLWVHKALVGFSQSIYPSAILCKFKRIPRIYDFLCLD